MTELGGNIPSFQIQKVHAILAGSEINSVAHSVMAEEILNISLDSM